MAFRLRCPECRGAFPFDPAHQSYPDDCPLCGEHIGHNRADDDVVMPSIRSARMAVSDKLYRDMERGSEQRAQIAAEMTGAPVSEMSDMKITNLNDARRQGDIAAVPVQNDVTRFMEANKVGGFQGGGVEYSAAVQSGPHANAGARMRTALQQHHTTLTGGAAVSDRPALETMQPGYRRRG